MAANIQRFSSSYGSSRVANLAFLKPDIKILGILWFLSGTWLFFKSKKLDKIWIFMFPNSCLKLTNVDPYDTTHEIEEQYRKLCFGDRVNEVFSDSIPPAQRFPIWGTCTPRVGVTKLRLAGHIRPADRFNPACQIPSTFFSNTTFPTVGSSATALAVSVNKISRCRLAYLKGYI